MQELLDKVRTQLTEYWGKLTNKNRIQIITAAVLAIVALVILGVVLSRPTMVRFKSDLTAGDMSQIRAALDESSIAYRITDNATTLYVDERRAQDASMIMADIGIVTDALMTYQEALDNSLTTTQTEKQLKIQLAFENEMNRKIEVLDAVRKAYVKLYIGNGNNTVFDQAEPSSASVTLELVRPLNDRAIQGIVSSLKNSVRNLDTTDITIITTTGEVLYDGLDQYSMAASVNTQVEYVELLKQIMRNDLTAQLLSFGLYDDVAINVTLDVDFDETTIIDRNFEQGPIQWEYMQETDGINTSDGGIPGTDANQGIVTYPMDGGGFSEYNTATEERRYDNDELVTSIVRSIGGINYNNSRMSVALNQLTYIYEDTVERQGLLANMTWDEYIAENDRPTALEVPEEIERLIQNGTNIDQISVVAYNRPMFISKEVQELELLTYLPIGIIIILLGLLAFAVYKGTEPVEVEETQTELSVEEMLESTKEKQSYDTIEFDEKSDIRKQIEKFVETNPDAVSNLLRNWINEDWE